MAIKENINKINIEITNAELRFDRKQGIVKLLAVSKTKPIELLKEAYECGQRIFGENKVQEAELKFPQMPSDTEFHMIGHLQSNKVSKACKVFTCIQSVDSLKIAKKINNCCKELGKTMFIYLDINISTDENKTGFENNNDFLNIFEEILSLSNIEVKGLMCIGAYTDNVEVIKKSFTDLRELLDLLHLKFPSFKEKELSMGMSSDYIEAIEMGSTMVRVGSSIFGHRN
ncbi:MAG: YggS family pyridoxal phosphate-dependent enzyme [Spirochaetaceae bacterium]